MRRVVARYTRARIESLNNLRSQKAWNRLWNRLDWGLRELDVSAPNDLRGEALLQWARARLQEAATESVEASDRIAAARALVSSAHAELELIDKRAARAAANEHPAIASPPSLDSLPTAERERLLRAAMVRIEGELARLGENENAPAGLLGAEDDDPD